MMRPFEEEGDILVSYFNLKRYPGRIAQIAKEGLNSDTAVDVAGIERSLAPLNNFLRRVSKVEGEYVSAVASAYVSLCRAVRALPGIYRQYSRTVDPGLEAGRDLASALDWKPVGITPTEEEMIGLAAMMSRHLSSYRLMLEHTTGLALLLKSGDIEAKWLATKTTNYLERKLVERCGEAWRGVVLGGEYIHVEKALSRRRMWCSPEEGALRLRHGRRSVPSGWVGTYSYAAFAAMVERVAMWECAWILGRTLEKAETEVYIKAMSFHDAEMRRADCQRRPDLRLIDTEGDRRLQLQ